MRRPPPRLTRLPVDHDLRCVEFAPVDVNLGAFRDVDLKPLRDDKDWSLGANYRARPGETLTICPRFQVARGRATRRWPDASGGPLGQRGVWVYTPPGMSVNPGCRYPVLYMHDGQNLFDPRAAFGGVTWQVAETLDAGANAADPAAAVCAEAGSDRKAVIRTERMTACSS